MAYQRIFGDTATGGAQTTINKNAKYQPILRARSNQKLPQRPCLPFGKNATASNAISASDSANVKTRINTARIDCWIQ